MKTEQYVEIAAGLLLIGLGVFGHNFAWGGFGAARRPDATKIPRLLGRALFVLIGLWWIYSAFSG